MSASYFENNAIPVGDALLQSYDEMPSRLEMAIALFTRTGTSDAMGSVHAQSIRIPTIEHVTIEALARYSGLSKNKVIVQLLEVALDEVFQGLSAEQRAELFQIRGKLLLEMCGPDGFPKVEAQSEKGEI